MAQERLVQIIVPISDDPDPYSNYKRKVEVKGFFPDFMEEKVTLIGWIYYYENDNGEYGEVAKNPRYTAIPVKCIADRTTPVSAQTGDVVKEGDELWKDVKYEYGFDEEGKGMGQIVDNQKVISEYSFMVAMDQAGISNIDLVAASVQKVDQRKQFDNLI